MLVALAADEVAVRVVDVRPLELAALHRRFRFVRCGQARCAREVGGREEQRAVRASRITRSISRERRVPRDASSYGSRSELRQPTEHRA